MKKRASLPVLILLAASVFTGGCLLQSLTEGDLQTLVLFFKLTEDIPQGQPVAVHSTVYHHEVRLKGQFVRISGRINSSATVLSSSGSAAARLAGKAAVSVVGEDLESGKTVHKLNVAVTIGSDGTFSATKKFPKNIDPDTLQTVTVEAKDGDIPLGSEIAICVDIAKKKQDLTAESDCSSGPEMPRSNAHLVQVLDNRYEPQSITIQPGESVRWELQGSDPGHTVTAMGATFDSGFIFTRQGAFFERNFPSSADGQTFEYFCQTHQACCQMQGSVRVGNSAPQPSDGY